jgi:hypothetical protein
MISKYRFVKNYFRVISIFLFCTAVILVEVVFGEYSKTQELDWGCIAAAILNLGVSLFLRLYE